MKSWQYSPTLVQVTDNCAVYIWSSKSSELLQWGHQKQSQIFVIADGAIVITDIVQTLDLSVQMVVIIWIWIRLNQIFIFSQILKITIQYSSNNH